MWEGDTLGKKIFKENKTLLYIGPALLPIYFPFIFAQSAEDYVSRCLMKFHSFEATHFYKPCHTLFIALTYKVVLPNLLLFLFYQQACEQYQ